MAKLKAAVVLALSVLISVACQSRHTRSSLPLPPDHSLLSAAYIKKGFPAFNRFWTGEDYRQAGVVLRGLAARSKSD